MAGNPENIVKYQFKPGQTGNPNGQPKNTLKKYAAEHLKNMTEAERLKFFNAIEPYKIWEMAEGKPKQDIEIEGEMVSKVISADE